VGERRWAGADSNALTVAPKPQLVVHIGYAIGYGVLPSSTALRRTHTDTPQRLSDGNQLVPPLGATWGLATSSTSYTTSTMSWSDDSAMGSATQTGSATLGNEFYVYWVDGASTPYYVFVLRQTIRFAPGLFLRGSKVRTASSST
jgi:hypothetical protein